MTTGPIFHGSGGLGVPERSILPTLQLKRDKSIVMAWIVQLQRGVI